VAQLAREIAAVMALPDIRERLVALGSDPVDSNPSSFAAFIRNESEKWGEIVRSSRIKAD
jgi:tripartite-type tricarboxylate transporter receptor subunit TctC